MNSRFFHYFKVVAAFHIGVVLVIILASGWRRFFRRKPALMMPVEFVVEVPAQPPNHELLPRSVVSEKDIAVPESKPKARPKKKKIKRSTTRMTRRVEVSPSKKQLTSEEIKKLLSQGATPGDHTLIPDDDMRQFEIVRRILYNAWVQPSAEEAGEAVTEISIRLQQDGRIIERNMKRKSGNAAMDESVMQAVNSIHRIDGLSPAFVRRYSIITVSFKVE